MIENTEPREDLSEKRFSKIFLEFRSHSPVRKVRMIVMYLVTSLAYLSTVYLLFFKEEILSSMIPLFVFFAFFHFAYLEIRHRGFLWIFTIFGIASILEILILGFGTWQVPTTVLIFNAAIIILSLWLKGASGDKRKFRPRGYFAVGGYIFTIFMTIAYSLFLIGGKGNFDLSCTNIEKTSNNFLETMMTPFQFGKKQIQVIGSGAEHIKDSLKGFFTTNVGDLVGLSQQIELQESTSLSNNNDTIELGLGDKISEKFQQIKANISTAVDENLQLNLGICDLILHKIEKTYEHPAFQFAVVLLMFVLLFPFVRIAFFIISLLAFFVFMLLYRLGIYKKHKVLEEVEEIV